MFKEASIKTSNNSLNIGLSRGEKRKPNDEDLTADESMDGHFEFLQGEFGTAALSCASLGPLHSRALLRLDGALNFEGLQAGALETGRQEQQIAG